MNTKIKILILSFVALFGLFINANVSFAEDTCNSHTVYGDVWVTGGSVDMLTWFNYGRTTSYGNTTPPRLVTVTAGTPLAVSANLTNLNENTNYHYILMMKVGRETRDGGDKTFSTPSCPVTPAPTVTISANPSSVEYNQSSTISWSSTDATSCTASGAWSGTKNTSGDIPTGNLTSSKTYNITCTGAGGSASGSTTVTVGQQILNPDVTLIANPSSIRSGDISVLSWTTTTNATYCSTSWAGTMGASGTSNVSPTSTTTYSITCTNSTGRSASSSVTIFVTQQNSLSPSVNIYADDENIDYGDNTTIRWTTNNNPTSCYASGGSNGWSGSQNERGGSFRTGSLTYTRTYKITCTNNAGSGSDSVTIYVDDDNNNDRPDVNLSANSTNVSYGSSTTIKWNPTENPTYCTASNGSNGWSGSQSRYSSSFSTGALYNTTTYTMTCGNNAGSSTESVTVYVNNQNTIQPNVTLTADRTNVTSGESTIVRWYPANATSCYASGGSNGWAGNKSIYSGTFNTGALTYSTTYSITCSGSNGTSDVKSVTVSVNNQQPIGNRPTVNIYADSTSLSYNGATFVRWASNNATSCTAGGGSLGWEGVKSIGPGSFYTGSLNTSKTFSIVCSNNFGSASDSVNVTVRGQVYTDPNPTPTPTSLVLITSSVDRNQPIVPTIDNSRPKPGDEINYTVNYQNIGTGSITNLTLQMNLPQEVSYMFSNPNNPNMSGNGLIFNLGTLKANGQGTVTVRVRVRDNISAGTNLNFPATLSYRDPSGQFQSVNANVSAQVWSETLTPTQAKETIQLGALAFLFGNDFLPNSLLGWLLLILLITLVVLAIKKMYYGPKSIVVSEDKTASH